MKKLIRIILTLLIIPILSCSQKKIINMEIEAVYDKKDNSYTITYPEYNKQYPKFINLKYGKSVKINEGISLTYNIDSDNIPIQLNIEVEENNTIKKLTIENPLVNRNINLTLYATNFNPPLEKDKLDKLSISIETIGNIDTKDTVKIAINEYDDKRKPRENIALILPESGHIAKSNPPFVMINKRTTLTRISISKELSFTTRYEYTLRNNSFFSVTNTLENGKWYIAFDENGDTNLRKIYHFFIDDSSTKIIPITNKTFNIPRPFVFIDKQTFEVLYNLLYKANRLQPSVLLRNINAFRSYTAENMGKWSVNNISYSLTDDTNKLYFENLPSHTMVMSLKAAFEPNNNLLKYEIKQMIRDIVNLDETKIENYNIIDAVNILANSLLMPFDLMYDEFSPEEIVLMKQEFIKYGETLYNYIIENPSEYRNKNTIKYVTTLGLIAINMLNENVNQDQIRNWHYFSMNYINSMVFSMFESDGSFKSSISEAFDTIMPILTYALSLKNVGIFDAFSLESFRNIGKYLSIVGYPSGYTLPIGYTAVYNRSKLRFDTGARNAVMELLSKMCADPLYKNYAVFAQSEAADIRYLPYALMCNNYYLRDNVNSNVDFQYETLLLKKIQTAIYNENIKTLNAPYLAVYAKGRNTDNSLGLNHNDRMSFVYYNYGDSIIDELGYNFDSNNYTIFKDADFHNGISIDGNKIEENMGSYSYIENITNYYKMFYAHAKANQRYTYPINLKNYDRRFYYLKPNILVIKEDIEALPDITREYHVYGYKYKWNVNSKLPITFDNESNRFIIDGAYSYTYIQILSSNELEYNVVQTNIGQNKLYTAQAATRENVKKFEPWIIVSTMPKNNVPIAMRRNILNPNTAIVNFDSTNLNFIAGNKEYRISIDNSYINTSDNTNKINNILYTENRESVIISSD
ncbi:RNA polymerase subunit sigma-70 [Brachyspira hyodysenteriae]|uniref:RNA polymerase subunit sigma-70 n=1 Tax=Brachyspira hyodysenteriae TaxID=159 RepID=UPI0022CD4E91|nr:RNA polymerase subunit sigma-70 [Brachyspira hyodysenteriae]MCZ9850581.1 RNA polymerase subunit sigma-70 [Brachyspira hyodysenteriae]MCZ9860667.1 RNA polymerase subunit sigma-70 [Brachyspira hyodysenteriae]MCZ9875742.1 RNA polymerase subunit sigma-70 [Brachyspira hyodysenteriae]MCZ9895475.1 RNA polymerase subunit sigma-70 [Brachyspira hyodysenteriae]MCZ9900746.1 RNA polymerase subunit sigma-70 [Brachyspira hyodysenteriae]